jgi:hypothetical protein
MASIASKAAPKAATQATAAKTADPSATCSHKDAEGVRDCKSPRSTKIKRPSFCEKHEAEAAQMRKDRAAAKRAASQTATPKAKAAAKPKAAKVPANGGGNLSPVKPPAPPRVAHPRVKQQPIAAMVAVEPPAPTAD